MKQADIDRAVASATGETVSTVKRLGFLLADPTDSLDPDSDEHDSERGHRSPAVLQVRELSEVRIIQGAGRL